MIIERYKIEDVNKLYNKKYELVVYNADRTTPEAIKDAYSSANNDNVLAIIRTTPGVKGIPLEEKIPTIHIGGIKNESTDREIFYSLIKEQFLKIKQAPLKLSNKELIKRISFV